jgi:hypothetical protein
LATGTATVDFGAFPGTSLASVAVTGQTEIGAGSKVEAYTMAESTSDHTVNDHLYAGSLIALTCGNIVAGTGFTIYATCLDQMQGTFAVHWVWV